MATWYKKWWFIVIIIIICLVLVSRFLNNLADYKTARDEYNQIYPKIEQTSDKISNIETKYSKNGLVRLKTRDISR